MRSGVTHAALPVVALAAALATLPVASRAGIARIEFAGGSVSESVQTMEIGGTTYFDLTDLARALRGVRHWNPLTRKMTLALGEHRIAMSDGNQFVVLDRVMMNVRRPVLSKGGAFFVPPAFVTEVLAQATGSEIALASDGALTISILGPRVGAPVFRVRGGATVVALSLSRPAEFVSESPGPGVIDVFVPGGRLVGAAGTYRGSGNVASIGLYEAGAGVRATIELDGTAVSSSAVFSDDPPRIEVIVQGAGQVAAHASAGELGPFASEAFARRSSDVKTVMIDPGHGGRDAGAAGLSGLLEKNAVLALAEELSAVLKREGFRVFMTRSGDTGVPVKRRAEIANLAFADVFVSIQCDASFSRSTQGFRVWYERPGGVGLAPGGRGWTGGLPTARPGPGPRQHDDLLWSRVQDEHAGESVLLAELVRGAMAHELATKDRGIRAGDLALLSGCAMPAVLVEVGCLTNPSDEELLADESFRKAAARAIARGIIDYREMSPRGRSL